MRNAELVQANDYIVQLEAVYGRFDIGLDGLPTEQWENRNLKRLRLPEMLEHQFFSGVNLLRVQVNRRMMGALERVYLEIGKRWSLEARRAHGLNRFVKCYCFGDSSGPNLFWYGAAWELSPLVNGEVLDSVIDLFKQHGFKHDRKRLRVLEYW
jgi:hypothetical protein